jgi:hypothetical protein
LWNVLLWSLLRVRVVGRDGKLVVVVLLNANRTTKHLKKPALKKPKQPNPNRVKDHPALNTKKSSPRLSVAVPGAISVPYTTRDVGVSNE